jgi:3-methyladenine DNA glycosylase AlkD
MNRSEIQDRLMQLSDAKYRDFQSALMPTVDKSLVIGVRMPLLRKYAKELKNDPEATDFLVNLPHRYYEENLLHGLLISDTKDFSRCMAEVERFLPYIDNWAVCDMLNPKALKNDLLKLKEKILSWLDKEHTYTVRFAIGMLMRHFLCKDYIGFALETVAAVQSEEYYINMMCAWFFATALAMEESQTLPYFFSGKLSRTVERMAVRKARESFRVREECKRFLLQKSAEEQKRYQKAQIFR